MRIRRAFGLATLVALTVLSPACEPSPVAKDDAPVGDSSPEASIDLESADALAALAAELGPLDMVLVGSPEVDLRHAADRAQLAASPDNPDNVRVLVELGRPDDARALLSRLVESDPRAIAAALRALGNRPQDLCGRAALNCIDVQKSLLKQARARVSVLSGEDRADAELEMLRLEQNIPRPGASAADWEAMLRAFIAHDPRTVAALLAHADLAILAAERAGNTTALDEFVRAHPGTSAAARVLRARANMAAAAMSSDDQDPSVRLAELIAIVEELQSGRYPDAEWVRSADSLVVDGVPMDRIRGSGLERVIDRYEDFLRRQLDADAVDAAITDSDRNAWFQLALLYERRGDPAAALDAFVLSIPGARRKQARALQAEVLMARVPSSNGRESENATRVALRLVEKNAGAATPLFRRRALLALGALHWQHGAHRAAYAAYKAYLDRYPDGPAAAYARLRLALAAEVATDARTAVTAYRQAAAAVGARPEWRVAALVFAGRTSESVDRFDEAVVDYVDALACWRDLSPVVNVWWWRAHRHKDSENTLLRDHVRARLAQLQRSLRSPGGAALERGRRLLADENYVQATKVLDEVLALSLGTPVAADAQRLLHRAQLASALQRIQGADRTARRSVLTSLDALSREPYDDAVGSAKLARATLSWVWEQAPEAPAQLDAAVYEWMLAQAGGSVFVDPAIARDVEEIRSLVVRPRYDGIFAGEDRSRVRPNPARHPELRALRGPAPRALPGPEP